MTDLPEIRDGSLPMGEARRGENNRAIDFKTSRLIQCLIVGVAEEIDDNVVGRIPARVPLDLRQAARAIGMRLSRARALQLDATFQSAFKTAVEAYRESQEPANIATCIEIRDNPMNRPKERIRAVEVLRGAKPVAAAIFNNQLTQNIGGPPVCAGYVIDLREPEQKTIEREPRVIDASPREGNAGEIAADVAAERAETRR